MSVITRSTKLKVNHPRLRKILLHTFYCTFCYKNSLKIALTLLLIISIERIRSIICRILVLYSGHIFPLYFMNELQTLT